MALSSIYRHANHEFYKVWLRMVDPDSQDPSQCVAYLRVSCFVVGPDERPPIHANDEVDEENGNSEEDLDAQTEQ